MRPTRPHSDIFSLPLRYPPYLTSSPESHRSTHGPDPPPPHANPKPEVCEMNHLRTAIYLARMRSRGRTLLGFGLRGPSGEHRRDAPLHIDQGFPPPQLAASDLKRLQSPDRSLSTDGASWDNRYVTPCRIHRDKCRLTVTYPSAVRSQPSDGAKKTRAGGRRKGPVPNPRPKHFISNTLKRS